MGFAAIILVHPVLLLAFFLIVSSARWGVARLVGLEKVRFVLGLPGEEVRGPGWGLWLQSGAALLGWCAFVVSLFAVSAKLHGRDVQTDRIVVVPGLPAARAGVRDGDRVVAVDGQTVESFEQLGKVIRPRSGMPTPLRIERGAEQLTIELVPESGPQGGRIGLWPLYERRSVSVGEAMVLGWAGPRTEFARLAEEAKDQVRALRGSPGAHGPVQVSREVGAGSKPDAAGAIYYFGAMAVRFYWLFALLALIALHGLTWKRMRAGRSDRAQAT